MNWNQIVREHGPPTYQTAWRILHHAQDCEDVMQDVFIEAHKLFQSGQVTHWRTFLHRLVTFRALDSLRRRKVCEPLDDNPLEDGQPDPHEQLDRKEQNIWIRDLVSQLPDRQAAVFCLVHFDGLSHEEVAATLEISLNAVGMALHKSRKTLRSVILRQREENKS